MYPLAAIRSTTASYCNNRAAGQRFFFFFQAEDGIRDLTVTGVQTCALPICKPFARLGARPIRPVGLAPQRALPVARLPQQVVPGDAAVVRRLEQVNELGSLVDRKSVV